MIFENRADAGLQLADALQAYRGTNSVVLVIPRGAAVLGAIIARQLELPMEVLLTKKLGYPNDKEFAIGAVSLKGVIIDKQFRLPEDYLTEEVDRIREVLRKREELYHQGLKPVSLSGKTAVLVDDGIATGNTMLAAIELARQEGATKVVVAVPVAPEETIQTIRQHADEVICLAMPDPFYAIGLHYTSFPEVTDDEVVELLQASRRVSIEGARQVTRNKKKQWKPA
jgi:predicted phosphoribosyltransferase